jgi:uncharacterized protein YndB with AHSA1/START domain
MAGDTNIKDDAVVRATGHPPAHWFRLLDRWKGGEKGHTAMARWLREEQGLSAWWCQMVTVMYERARGLRKVHERPTGYSIDVSRVVRTTARKAFDAMATPAGQSTWFTSRATIDLRVGGRYENADGDSGEFLKVERPKRLRFTWGNRRHAPGSVVDYVVTPLEDGRVRIGLTHSKLTREKDAKDLKAAWGGALDLLRARLEAAAPKPRGAAATATRSGPKAKSAAPKTKSTGPKPKRAAPRG